MFSEAQIQQLSALITQPLSDIRDRLTTIEDRMTGIEDRLTAVEIGHRRMNALHINSTLGRTEQLIPVPREEDGLLPTDHGAPFPATLERLIVLGNETLPSAGVRNDWEKSKSIALLNFYGEDEATDNEDEYSDRSRARRLRLAKKLGLSQSQLNFAQLTL